MEYCLATWIDHILQSHDIFSILFSMKVLTILSNFKLTFDLNIFFAGRRIFFSFEMTERMNVNTVFTTFGINLFNNHLVYVAHAYTMKNCTNWWTSKLHYGIAPSWWFNLCRRWLPDVSFFAAHRLLVFIISKAKNDRIA